MERLDRGADVISECTGDVVKNCKELPPAVDASRTACSATSKACRPPLLDGSGRARPEVLSDGENAVSKRIDMHNLRYIEIFLADIDPNKKGLVAACYGSYAIPVIPANRDSSPQSQVAAALNMDEIARKYGVLAPPSNGPKLSIADWWGDRRRRPGNLARWSFRTRRSLI